MADIIVLSLLAIAIFLVIRYRIKASKNGEGCCGCTNCNERATCCEKKVTNKK